MMWRILVFALALGLATQVGACGKKSLPEPPEDTRYPRTYPTQ